jgi:transposase
MLLAPADPGVFPPVERLTVVTLASSQTTEQQQSDSSWTLDNLAFQILRDAHHRDMSRSTIGRILAEADLKPHRSQYWLNSHDPDFDDKAKNICQLYLDATRFYEEGRLVLSSDEKTGMQILQRKYPTRPAKPGFIEKREFEYIRHGTRALLTTFCVPTGQVVSNLGKTRTSVDWVRHLDHVATQFSHLKRFDWIVDNLNTHWSLDVCRWVADRSGVSCNVEALETGQQRRAFLSEPSHKHVFHFTPIHGSWLNQVELFFSVLSRRFLKRGDFASAAEFEERLNRWLISYNRDHAHPYRWTYTGEPLVRDTPFSQTRRQLLRGRAWCGVGQNLWQRRLYPPRPYHRHNDQKLAKDL